MEASRVVLGAVRSVLCSGARGAPRRCHVSAAAPVGSRSLVDAWAARVNQLQMVADESQRAAVERLEQYDREASMGDRCALRPWAYLYGPVGSGKTLLLDHFAAHARASAGGRVMRAHFHDFMLSVHEQLHKLQSRRPKRVRKTLSGLDVYEYSDPEGASAVDTLSHVASVLAARADLICLDELCVTDLADALILSRLAKALLHEGVRLAFTSNQPPARLFESCENRARYVGELAALLRARCVPVRVGVDGVDYRALGPSGGSGPTDAVPSTRTLAHRASGRYFAGGVEMAAPFDFCWAERAAADGGERRSSVPIAFSRRWPLECTTDGAVRLRFDEACGRGRGAADFLALAKAYDTLFLERVPAFSGKQEDEARRFVTLVDVCYDWQMRLVVHASAPREHLFDGLRAEAASAFGGGGDAAGVTAGDGRTRGELAWMISRCTSRLVEMTGGRA